MGRDSSVNMDMDKRTKSVIHQPLLQLQTIVYTNLSHNCLKLEATKMPFHRRMDKQTVMHPDDGM